MNDYTVYLLDWRAAGGSQYVGMTVNLPNRLKQHRSTAPSEGVEAAWRDYGEPSVAVLADGLTRDEAISRERLEIACRRPDCYNKNHGGDGSAPAEHQRLKVSCVLDASLVRKLEEIADRDGCSMASVMRKAVIRMLDRCANPPSKF